ncbi:P-loop containing nucleoside triphosphate hydrolase protein [Artomyces pyxidatus]|uniref:P-loop containing nucleoside triphosphate hydrolase protein n=1 Tax=Artomyces pyxidatus TaxID=48021 RepID=A0ACB8STT5_9AGAM|nr:P-loop containing nucleoside triphosphate hydrolase protein [Artomyces pyxidatus]
MPDDQPAPAEASVIPMPETRGYQQEMLEESLRRNIVIALDTGAGKTHIAVLRMKLEAERVSNKVSWFLAPTVALAHQQREVIAGHLPVSVGMISGSMEPDQWKDAGLWRRILLTHRIVVTTHDVLLNALRHGYINMGRDINLLIFDEAHHAADKHPYNLIMKEFYVHLPPRMPSQGTHHPDPGNSVRPMILGLTASPIFGGDVEKAFRKIESNLDCTIRAPLLFREELAGFVHRPEFKHAVYAAPTYMMVGIPPSKNLSSLANVVNALNIEDDPYVHSLREELRNLAPGPERTRLDQKLSKTINKRDTYTHKGLRDFLRAADEICMDLGSWAADWYIQTVLKQAQVADGDLPDVASIWSSREKSYLLGTLSKVAITTVSYDPVDIVTQSSDKVRVLVETLLAEKAFFEAHDEDYRGLVFVTRRDAVLALTQVLTYHPQTAEIFQVGSLLGNSESSYRRSFLDITRHLLKQPANETLSSFRIGELNVIIATAVAEEGLDIQACCSVVRWDPPPNMVSWAQSRGRARQKRSTFTVMFSNDTVHRETVQKWELLEKEMVRLYNTNRLAVSTPEEDDLDSKEQVLRFRVDSTGALLTTNSAIEHLTHFCAILPHGGRGNHAPVYDIDPPDYPAEWHTYGGARPLYEGPYGCTVTLPKLVDPAFRTFSTPRVHRTKVSAKRNVAYQAYLALYENGLLNDNLLPLTSVLEPELEDEVRNLLKEVEKRDGTARVTTQMDPWFVVGNPDIWWSTEIGIEGMPSMQLLSQAKLPPLHDDEMPYLHTRERAPFRVRVASQSSPFPVSGDILSRARDFTRRVLWPIYGARMPWDRTDYLCLLLPVDDRLSLEWDAWRQAYSVEPDSQNSPYKSLFAPTAWFRDHFGRQKGLSVVNAAGRFGKVYQFLRWRTQPVSKEEEAELLERYAPDGGGLEITYPLLQVKPLVKRNFIIPMPPEAKGTEAASQKPFLLLEDSSAIGLLSPDEAKYALWFPSLLRYLSMASTVIAMRTSLFADSPLAAIPMHLLLTATTTPVSQESSNYQRLETLGDTVLKYVTSIQLLAEYPLWHEGYLSRKKDHSVSNARLAKAAIGLKLYTWIIRDRLVPKKWKPRYVTNTAEDLAAVEADSVLENPAKSEKERRRAKVKQDLSTKVLADVVEALIGAAYLHGGFSLGIECAKLFDLGVPWRMLPERIDSMLSRVIELKYYPAQLEAVEAILGYNFHRKTLLVEALTHASYQSDLETISYERMEFLGDSVLDMIVTDYLYHAPGKEYSPGQMHQRKSAIVNAHFLAMICLRACTEASTEMPRWSRRGGVTIERNSHLVYLWQCLLHSSVPVLDEQNATFSRWERPTGKGHIEAALANGNIFPWAALTSLRAPKFLSDMVESLLGAVFLDSAGDLDTVRDVLRRLGVLQILERIVEDDVDVRHPVSRLFNWASKRHEKVQCGPSQKDKSTVSCAVLWEGFEIAKVEDEWRGRISQEDVRFRVAEQAIELLEHPPSFLRKWANKRGLEVEFQMTSQDDDLTCAVIIADQEIFTIQSRGQARTEDVQSVAAVHALKILEQSVSWLQFLAARHRWEVEYVIYEEDGIEVCSVFVDGREEGRFESEGRGKVTPEDMQSAAAKDAITTLEERLAETVDDEGDGALDWTTEAEADSWE